MYNEIMVYIQKFLEREKENLPFSYPYFLLLQTICCIFEFFLIENKHWMHFVVIWTFIFALKLLFESCSKNVADNELNMPYLYISCKYFRK